MCIFSISCFPLVTAQVSSAVRYVTSNFGMMNYPVLVSDINENNFVFEYTPSKIMQKESPVGTCLAADRSTYSVPTCCAWLAVWQKNSPDCQSFQSQQVRDLRNQEKEWSNYRLQGHSDSSPCPRFANFQTGFRKIPAKGPAYDNRRYSERFPLHFVLTLILLTSCILASANSQDKDGEQLNFMYFACKNTRNDSKVCCPLIGQKNTKVFWHQSEARMACVAWRFCRTRYWAAKPQRRLRTSGFSALTRPYYYFARPTEKSPC